MYHFTWRQAVIVLLCMGMLWVLVPTAPSIQADRQASTHFFPVVIVPESPVGPPLPPPEIFSTPPPMNLAAITAQLGANGLELGLNKIGFHVGAGGNRQGLDVWMQEQDAEGIPFFRVGSS